MSRLSIADIDSLRANSAPIPCTIAPSTSSESFKSAHNHAKPKSTPLSHHFSLESRGFHGSALKNSARLPGTRKVISLGTGRPTAEHYPWNAVLFQAKGNALPNEKCEQMIGKHDEGYNLSLALSYGHAAGSPHLVRFVTEHVELVHNPPYADWGTMLSAGSTSALEIALRVFCNRGDTILAERYTYSGAVEVANLVGAQVQGIRMDSEGMCPDHLREVLSSWNEESRGPRPSVLYTIPSGQNPTGATQSVARRRAIYQVAEEFDLVVIEDDPYYFLRLGDCTGQRRNDSDQDDIPSYLSLDRAGRVVRLDSASKILAPGLRAGWVTASSLVIDKFLAYHEVSTIAVNGPAQLMLWKLLDDTWGHQGFFSWLDNLSRGYRSRRDTILDACKRYLPKEVCDWVPPEYGMFLWVKLDWKKHPRFKTQTEFEDVTQKLVEIEGRIMSCALLNGAQVTKGSLFQCNKDLTDELHFRMTFAAAPEGDLAEGVRIFANAVTDEFSC
ncbi:L-kynurenine/alpha-aminoadipate aminotransferase [Aspergillus steynii IBT 23096]|uniref:L-kynurenine/alpha-aminoadipate aminotransferase n=1 Tax=Aspergillus steynii IBT 23096 TaxID=1392250 RepID=A0A2I2FXX3_9EURO|nr:L-kynurenine/alpha-aminoadipate aminotransferase [Aspergillus steynii IBT 23096]PLB45481.1 L-kynurenine/alpha-aminoadipate aminotransferase [Aspergillus steynii IBT 23096]